jgi:hypothetical protein
MREVKIRVDVAHFVGQRLICIDAILELFALLQDGLSLFLVLPEVRIAYFLLDGSEAFLRGGRVKDSSARARYVSSARRSAVVSLRYVQASSVGASDVECGALEKILT